MTKAGTCARRNRSTVFVFVELNNHLRYCIYLVNFQTNCSGTGNTSGFISCIMFCIYFDRVLFIVIILYMCPCPIRRVILLFHLWSYFKKDRLFIFQILTRSAWVYQLYHIIFNTVIIYVEYHDATLRIILLSIGTLCEGERNHRSRAVCARRRIGQCR
jgi:hypothetical protein